MKKIRENWKHQCGHHARVLIVRSPPSICLFDFFRGNILWFTMVNVSESNRKFIVPDENKDYIAWPIRYFNDARQFDILMWCNYDQQKSTASLVYERKENTNDDTFYSLLYRSSHQRIHRENKFISILMVTTADNKRNLVALREYIGNHIIAFPFGDMQVYRLNVKRNVKVQNSLIFISSEKP